MSGNVLQRIVSMAIWDILTGRGYVETFKRYLSRDFDWYADFPLVTLLYLELNNFVT